MRTRKNRFLLAVATALAVFFLLYFPDQDDGSGAVLGALASLVPVALALAALPRLRPLPERTTATRVRLVVLALAIGLAVGLGNLAVNYAMASLDPAIHRMMVTRWAEFSPWSVVVTGPIMEEIGYRLVLLTALAWLAARLTPNPRTILAVALGVSAVLFGVAHIFYGGVDSPLYATGMAIKTSGGGLVFGWVFWRWGLPYAVVCHCAANLIHLLLMPFLF